MVRRGSVEEIVQIISLIPEFIDPYPKDEFFKRLNSNKSLILVFEEGDQLLGFKCGYEREKMNRSFYSWMGAVIPGHRKNTIAKQLLEAMEAWCKKEGYDSLMFRTLNRHKAMLIFAINNGFNIHNIEQGNDKQEYGLKKD